MIGISERTARPAPSKAEVIGELFRPTLRATPWKPLAGAIAVAIGVVFWLTRNTCTEPCVSVEDQILALRIGMLLLTIGAAFVLDDPTEDTTAHLPVSRMVRRELRVAATIPVVLAAWQLLIAVAHRSSVDHSPFPTPDLTWELAAMMAFGFAISALAAPFAPERTGGVATGPAMVVLFALAYAIPHRIAVFSGGPLEQRWAAAHVVWRWVVAGGLAGFVWGSRDPGGSLLRRRFPGQLARRLT